MTRTGKTILMRRKNFSLFIRIFAPVHEINFFCSKRSFGKKKLNFQPKNTWKVIYILWQIFCKSQNQIVLSEMLYYWAIMWIQPRLYRLSGGFKGSPPPPSHQKMRKKEKAGSFHWNFYYWEKIKRSSSFVRFWKPLPLQNVKFVGAWARK